ncbi:S8 family serine peptidase [Halorarius halobius]|uniref:S8 family serine peptidase n=1 Tax=Halorarius halobius TaxID=2962671 RepID=UPI0020CFE40F|nr:S8 family serine peptidase [Halorarius halobius]
MQLNRRTLLKGAGATGAGLLAPGVGAAVDPTLDTGTDDLQEVVVVFRSRDDVDRLGRLDLADGYYKYKALPMGFTRLTGEQIRQVAGWRETLNVERNRELTPHNEDAREVTGAKFVQEELFYTGETVHVAVIDSGVDGDHPDLERNLKNHYRFVNPLQGSDPMWTEAGPANTGGSGHGTHVSGSIAGTGSASEGQYKGMAPDADLTVYSTTGGYFLFQITGAWDDLVAKQQEGKLDVQAVNNSYGAGTGSNYSPYGALQVATWTGFQQGMTPVFSAGNSYDIDTLNNYSIGPHVLCSAATDDEMYVTDFSSKGRKPGSRGDKLVNYDRKEAFENVADAYAALEEDLGDAIYTQSYSGTAGPGAQPPLGAPQVTDKQYHEWNPDAPEGVDVSASDAADVGFVKASLSWSPQGQDVDFRLYEGGKGSEGTLKASSTGGTGANPETLQAEIDPTKTYYFEVDPWAAIQADYTITADAYRAPSVSASRPFSLHRPSVGTPGKFVMSTLAPEDYNQAYPTIWYGQGVAIEASEGQVPPPALAKLQREQSEQADEPYYGQLSGTSMSGPVLTGLVALIYDAYRQTHGEFPDPMEVIATVEATAAVTRPTDPDDARWPHRTWTIGAGFADAKTAVQLAEDDELFGLDDYADGTIDLAGTGSTGGDGFVFSVSGSREDDNDVYTAGQTVGVELGVDANATATVRDRIPFGWEVLAPDEEENANVDVYTQNGNRYIEFTEIPTPSGDSEAATVGYFLEAPESTGQYQFGPAQAKEYVPDGESGDATFRQFTGTDTNRVVGVDQNDAPL